MSKLGDNTAQPMVGAVNCFVSKAAGRALVDLVSRGAADVLEDLERLITLHQGHIPRSDDL